MKTKTLFKGLAMAVAMFTLTPSMFAAATNDEVTIDGVVYRYKDGSAAVVSATPDATGHVEIAAAVTFDGDDVETPVTATIWAAFKANATLKSITLPDCVKKIEGQTFMNCTLLTEVTLPSALNMLSGSAFSGCTALEKLTFTGTAAPNVWNPTTLSVVATLTDIYIPEGTYEAIGTDDSGSETAPFSSWDPTTYNDMYEGGVKLEEVISPVPAVNKTFTVGTGLYKMLTVDGSYTASWTLNVLEALPADGAVTVPETIDYVYTDDAGASQTVTFTVSAITSIHNACASSSSVDFGNYLISHKGAIKQLNFPGSVTFDDQCFKELASLNSINSDLGSGIINLPEGMTYIPTGFLLSSTNYVTAINVPASVTEVKGNFCFNGSQEYNSALQVINFLSETPVTFSTTAATSAPGSIFDRQPNLKAITFKSAEAAVVNELTFNAPNVTWNGIDMSEANDSLSTQTKDVVVYVPSGAVAAYQTAFEGYMGCVISITDEVYNSIESATNTNVKVAAINGTVIVAGVEAGAAVQVYSITGATVATTVAQDSDIQFSLPSGVYIVVVDGVAYKVAL